MEPDSWRHSVLFTQLTELSRLLLEEVSSGSSLSSSCFVVDHRVAFCTVRSSRGHTTFCFCPWDFSAIWHCCCDQASLFSLTADPYTLYLSINVAKELGWEMFCTEVWSTLKARPITWLSYSHWSDGDQAPKTFCSYIFFVCWSCLVLHVGQRTYLPRSRPQRWSTMHHLRRSSASLSTLHPASA